MFNKEYYEGKLLEVERKRQAANNKGLNEIVNKVYELVAQHKELDKDKKDIQQAIDEFYKTERESKKKDKVKNG